MSTHDTLYNAAEDSIKALHADTSVTTETTLASLQSLQGELGSLIEQVKLDATFEHPKTA